MAKRSDRKDEQGRRVHTSVHREETRVRGTITGIRDRWQELAGQQPEGSVEREEMLQQAEHWQRIWNGVKKDNGEDAK